MWSAGTTELPGSPSLPEFARSDRSAVSLGLRRGPFLLLPNVVDTDEFRPGERAAETSRVLLLVGRLVRQKRVDWFVHLGAGGETIAYGSARHDCRDGSRAGLLMQQAAALGLLPGIVSFRHPGPSNSRSMHQRMWWCLRRTTRGCRTSSSAMASGVPVVATRVGDVEELVQHGETGRRRVRRRRSNGGAIAGAGGQRKPADGHGPRRPRMYRRIDPLNQLPTMLEAFYGSAVA